MSEAPEHRPKFPLRRDYVWESGFVDWVRAPVTPETYARLCQTRFKKAFSWQGFETFNLECTGYPVPRYLLIAAAMPTGQTSAVPFVHDGKRWMFLARNDGLFVDVVRRVAAVVPMKGSGSVIVVPDRQTSADVWLNPPMCALHDAQTGVAEVWDTLEALTAIRHLQRK